jgi:hypothetical protein
MPKTLIVYGNCQAEAVATILRMDPAARESYRILYLRSFEHPSIGRDELHSEDVAACGVLWEQHDPKPFPYRDLLPADCVTVKFPAIDFNLFWPFRCANPYDEPELPIFPFGQFPYGDRIVLECVDKGMAPEKIIAHYRDGWDKYGVDLDRLLQLESARLTARDAHCDVKMGEYVMTHFREERLYWTPDHPSNALLRELMHRLLKARADALPALAELDIDATMLYRLSPEGPLGVISVPIHPRVAEHLGLHWYDLGERHQAYGGVTYSHDEYLEAMIRRMTTFKRAEKTRKAKLVRSPEKTLIVFGDAQAEALTAVMRIVPRIASRFDILYASNIAEKQSLFPTHKIATCAVFCEQQGSPVLSGFRKLPQDCLHVTFPSLDLNLLWPFNCINPYNVPEPPQFPYGRFPYGNSFVLNCVERGIPPREIMRYLLTAGWDASWPDLDRLYQAESARLLALDEKNNIKIGSYILKHFRTERLFWAVNNPTNKLFSELFFQLMHACFGSMIEREAAALSDIASREIFGTLSVPIHPQVATYFGLTWYDPRERHNYFDQRTISYEQYFEDLIATSYSLKGSSPKIVNN